MVTAADAPDLRLRLLTATLAVAQAIGDEEWAQRAARQVSEMLDPMTLSRLQPALLRTLAGQIGELGSSAGEAGGRILRAALRRLGIEQKTVETLDVLARILLGWIRDVGPEAPHIKRLLSALGDTPPPDPKESIDIWRVWLNNIPGQQLGNALAALLKAPRSAKSEAHASELQSALASYMSGTARAAIERGVRRAAV